MSRSKGPTTMKRWITVLLAAATLTGCITTREVVYREPYNPDGYANGAPYYDQGSYDSAPTYYQDGNSYYSPATGNRGDYYFGASNYGYNYGSFGVSYFDYPYYYSIFWPINRWYYDPFAYPNYYYGVTWFPRSYFSLSYSYGYSYSWLFYSPYRYSWVDHYYDWGHWYHHYPSYRHYYPTPRYGDARVEASRVAAIRRPYPGTYSYGGTPSRVPGNHGGPVAPSYSGNRAAIPRGGYGSTPRPGAYGSGPAAGDVRRVGANAPRVEPSTGLFGNPARGSQPIQRNRLDGPRTLNDSRRELTNRYDDRSGASRMPASGDVRTPDRSVIDSRSRPALPVRGEASAPVRTLPIRGSAGVPVRSAEPVTERTMPVRTLPRYSAPARTEPDAGIPIGNLRPVQRSAPIAPPTRSVGGDRSFQRQVESDSRSIPSRPVEFRQEPAPRAWPQTRSVAPNVERSDYAPARQAPMPSRQTEMPVRSAPTYSAPPPRQAAPEPSSGSRDGGVRRVGSNREE